MKKQLLLLAFLFISLIDLQAQHVCYLESKDKETTQVRKDTLCVSNDKMQAILKSEINRFTDYVAREFEYPELAKEYCFEGEMIVRVVYDEGFETVEITKSISPLLDRMVMNHITNYISNFDRKYVQAPRLVFKIPINFKLEG